MKKTLALLMAAALALSAAVLPALAEETGGTVDQVSSATIQNGNGSRQIPGNGQQMPGQSQGGQMPGNGQQMPGQSPNGQQAMPGRNDRNTKQGNRFGDRNTDTGNTRTGKHGKQMIFDRLLADNVISQDVYDAIMAYLKEHTTRQTGRSGKQLIFDQLLADSVISQDVYDAIMNYLKESATQQPADGSAPALPDGTAPSEGEEPPALPDGTAPAEGSEPPALPEGVPEGNGEDGSPEAQVLKELLDSGAITREQYDLLMNRITDAIPGNAG